MNADASRFFDFQSAESVESASKKECRHAGPRISLSSNVSIGEAFRGRPDPAIQRYLREAGLCVWREGKMGIFDFDTDPDLDIRRERGLSPPETRGRKALPYIGAKDYRDFLFPIREILEIRV